MSGPRPLAWLFLLLGWIALGAGIVGIPLPGWPTTPFLLLAAWLFSLGSDRVERWLLEHPRLGPPIRSWRRNRAVSLRAKITASILKLCALLLFYLQVESVPLTALLALVLLAVSVYLWRLPTPQQIAEQEEIS